jgi:dUTPase
MPLRDRAARQAREADLAAAQAEAQKAGRLAWITTRLAVKIQVQR